jgi:Bacterial Ig-like domain/L,D-transpeptidase catalytic domain
VLGTGQPRRRRSLRLKVAVAAAVVAALVVLADTAYLAVSAGSSKKPGSDARQTSARHARGPARPLHVMSITPASGTTGLSGAASIVVMFSAPVDGRSARPRLSPHVSGRWQVTGSMLTFTPASPLAPSTRYTLHVPAGSAGVRAQDGGLLSTIVTARFKTARYSQLRLAELLSTLGYLPLSWSPGAGGRLSSDPGNTESASEQAMAYDPPGGAFSWQRGYPAELRAQWRPSRPNPLVVGAVMAFKAQHHVAVTATTGRVFWHRLFAAAERDTRNAAGYTYAVASKTSPETLTIWHNGKVVMRSLANTGIAIRPTADGTFAVYLRYRFQVMEGTNPDGSHYADPVSYVAYFNGGDAVHYFPRGAYGFEQSLGCVELPYAQAEQAWPYLTYGSLVSVIG